VARSNRRSTFWEGGTLNNESVPFTGSPESYEIVGSNALTDEQDREPTLVRVFGRIRLGGVPAQNDETYAINAWWGLCLGGIGDPGLPDPIDMTDDRWIITGFLSTVWYNAAYPVPTIPLVTIVSAPRAYQGPWEMADFESHAMRKARTGDSLILRINAASNGADDPDRLDINGYVRSLWKAQS